LAPSAQAGQLLNYSEKRGVTRRHQRCAPAEAHKSRLAWIDAPFWRIDPAGGCWDRRKIEIERLSVTSSKPFDVVVAALEAAIGRPDMVEFFKATSSARTFADLESSVHSGLGRTGLMMFMKLDHGAILRKETGLDTPKILRFVIGNPLIMKEMAKHVPDARSYAPVTILVDERPDGVHLSYDKIAGLLAPYGNPDALAVARDLDLKIEDLLRQCAV
jgi:uncharacterized protein (DUF302 family)